MIYAVTVPLDIQTLDPQVPARLLGTTQLEPGAARTVPGGAIAFQSALLNLEPAEPSLYRFVLQFGAPRDAGIIGNWLFNELRGTATALHVAGHLIPLDHRTIIASLKQVA